MRETAFDPRHRIGQKDCDRIVGGNAVIGEMAGKLAGALEERGISHRCLRVAISALAAVRGGVPVQQFRNWSDQVGAQHRPAILKPC